MSSNHTQNQRFLEDLNRRIVSCDKCPRLREWCQEVARTKRASFADWTYWGKPVPVFGDPDATRLIVGLAPAAHGANRTGRMFTGDRSGDWLYRAMYEAGLANQPEAVSADDGLELIDTMIVASAHCAPPANKPTPEEIRNCSTYFLEVLSSRQWNAILCLGGVAWKHTHKSLNEKAPAFGHGVSHRTSSGITVFGSYHPSQQNTFTGKLTKEMLDGVMQTFAKA